MPLLIKSCLKEIPISEIEEGDIILHNDPYRGGLHTPEHTFFKPIFVDGEIVGFAVAIGHIAEVGGMAPGGFCGEATEIFQEGIRIPPVKIVKRGEDNIEVWKLLLANVRTPRVNYGDLKALIAAVDLGEKQMRGLYQKYGRERAALAASITTYRPRSALRDTGKALGVGYLTNGPFDFMTPSPGAGTMTSASGGKR